jgi:hypothetical protein
MKVLIISYDLKNPGRNYEPLIQRIKQLGPWARLGGSAYLISTANSVVQVRDFLWQVMDSSDSIYVGVAPAPAAWHGMPDDVGKWILNNQKV